MADGSWLMAMADGRSTIAISPQPFVRIVRPLPAEARKGEGGCHFLYRSPLVIAGAAGSVQNLRAYAKKSTRRAQVRKERMMGGTLGSWARTAIGSSAIVFVAGAALAAEPARTVTFTKDVAPIFQNKCESCHRADGMA